MTTEREPAAGADVRTERDPWYPGGQRDATIWVTEYFRIYPDGCTDGDTMLGWFANAIETGVMLGERAAAAQPAPVATSANLDAAWAEAEAALPEGWSLNLHDYGPSGPFAPGPGQEFHTPRYEAAAKFSILSSPPKHHGRSNESPAAALRALAAALRDRKPAPVAASAEPAYSDGFNDGMAHAAAAIDAHATHEAEMCGADCITLGLVTFDDDEDGESA